MSGVGGAPPGQGEAPLVPGGTRPSSRQIAWIAIRAAGLVTLLVAGYYLLPLDRTSAAAAIAILVGGLAVFIAVVAFQIRMIIRSPRPAIRAIEALSTSVPFFLLLFAGTYVVLADQSRASFGEHLSHTSALYFTVTVFATVGFGDITAKTDTARLVVTGQMIADLVILGLGVKLIVGAARRGGRRPTPPGPPTDGPGTPEPGGPEQADGR